MILMLPLVIESIQEVFRTIMFEMSNKLNKWYNDIQLPAERESCFMILNQLNVALWKY